MPVDLRLNKDKGYYDISFTSGDFTLTSGFDTAILMSIFCEKRANISEVPRPEMQRGWWGNLFNPVPNYEQGSKLWLLYQTRITNLTIPQAEDYVNDGLQWFLEENFATNLDVSASIVGTTLSIFVTLFRSNNVVFSAAYQLWEGTHYDNQFSRQS